MEFDKFTEIFAPVQATTHTRASTRAKNPLLAESRLQADVFQEIFSLYTSGELLSLSEIDTALRDHARWQRHERGKLNEALNDAVSGLDKDGSDASARKFTSVLSALSFHAINAACLPSWRRLADDPPSETTNLQRQQANANQVNLAFTALPMVGGLMRLTESGNYFGPNQSGGELPPMSQLAISLIGFLNEIDSAVILHEMAKKNPAIIVLPAPGQYERSGRRAGNIDQVVVDVDEQRIAPIQIKTSVSTKSAAGYHPDIVLIDGRADLGNERAIRLPNKSDFVSQPWSGLISVHHLALTSVARVNHLPGKGFAPTANDRRLLIAKQKAIAYSKVAKSRNSAATAIVTARVNNKLLREAA